MKYVKLLIVFAIAVSCLAVSYLFIPTTDDIPYTILDDSSIESHITKSYIDNGNLIIDIYNPNCEIVKVIPATIEHHVTAGMDSVKIFNYTDQYFEVIVGNASDVYTFGSLTKTWDAENKTVIIGTAEGEPLLIIERVSINPDLCTFEEVLNITSYVDYELNNLKDFRSRWKQFKGTNNITSVDWYIQKNQSYNVVVPEYGLIEQSQIIPNIIEYEDVTTTWDCGGCALGNCNSSQYWKISRNTANGTESGTICFDSYEVLQANPLKIKIYWNEIGVVGIHNETNYRNVWKQFSPIGKTIHAGQSYIIKVVYHKKPELGDVKIQTIPLFRGVECDELTWWNSSWNHRRNVIINHSMVSSAQTNFPVMVSITQLGLNTDGTDTRVTDSSDNQVAVDIECYNSGTGALVFFFNGTSISSTIDTSFWMYYNNSAATEPTASSTYGSEAVWDSNYVYVSHMADLTTSSIIDSTSNKRTSTKLSANNPIEYDAPYGKAQDFSSDNISMADSVDFDFTDFTFESYHYKDIDSAGAVMSKMYDGSARSFEFLDSSTSDRMDSMVNAAGTPHVVSADNSVPIQNWYYTALRHDDSSTSQWYVDGAASGSAVNIGAVNANAAGVKMGERAHPSGGVSFDGKIAEVRLSNILRSTGYVSTTSNNMHNPTATGTAPFFASFGAEENSFSITSYAPPTPLNKLESESQYFNVTTLLNCQCRWYINGSLKQTNTTQQTDHNYTNASLKIGYFNFSAVVNTSSGKTDMHTWWVTVTDPPFIPPDPTNLTNTTGNFWIRHAWDVGAGNITDEYAVNVNGSWYNTSDSFINLSKPPRGYQNITVQAWNSSGVGTLSAGTLSDNVSLPNNPVALTNYSLVYSIQEFDTISIDFDYTDADGDAVTFATDAVNGTLNNTTGVYNWTTTWMDRSVNHWTFNVSDGYGSVDSVVIEIEVTAYPISDLEDTFQYHASDSLSDTWNVDYETGGNADGGSTAYAHTIVNYQQNHSKAMYLRAYAKAKGYSIVGHYATTWMDAWSSVTTQAPTTSDYWSFVVRNTTVSLDDPNGYGSYYANLSFYDIEGYQLGDNINLLTYVDYPDNSLYEFILLENQMYLKINGESISIVGEYDDNLAYMRIKLYAYAKEIYGDDASTDIVMYIDDITTGIAITGIGVNHTDAPQYDSTHTWADSELWTVDLEIDTSWALKTTPIADYTAAEYTMKVQRVLTSEYVNTTIIKPAGEAPNDTLKPCGFINYSQPTLFGDNYGMYNFIIDKDGTTVATDYIYWMNMDISGDSYVVVDLPTYPAGAQISPSYFIDNINLVEYKYYIKTLSLFGTQMDISSDLLVDTGTVEVDTTGYDVTSYWCILVRESRADGSAVEMASDLFAITNTISAEGIVYNAESGSPLGDSMVALYQNGLWYNTTTNSTTGEYNLSDLTTDIDITVYAEHTGYTHESFTFTPLVAGIITLDIYMIPDTPLYNGTAIGGLALYAPYYQALNGATINLWNSSWSDDTASSATGYYLFDNIVNGSFTGNATMSGYSAATNEDIVTALGDYTQQNYLLQPQNILTVKAKDVSTHATIMTFSVVFDEGVAYETTDGVINITTGIGIYKVEVSADGYYVGIDYATVVSDTEITLYLVPVEESGEGIYYPSHYVSFIVQSITGTLYAGVTTSVYNAASANTTALFSDVTGSDGVVGFELNETTLYRITFVDAAQGINEEFTLYPIDTEYVVIVSSSISFVTEPPDTNLTNTTVEYTNQSWSIQNLTGDYLSTTLGISHTGQGVIAATICWATATIACGVPTLIVLGILAQLGVVSWIMVLFTGMTMLSIYILGGKIG